MRTPPLVWQFCDCSKGSRGEGGVLNRVHERGESRTAVRLIGVIFPSWERQFSSTGAQFPPPPPLLSQSPRYHIAVMRGLFKGALNSPPQWCRETPSPQFPGHLFAAKVPDGSRPDYNLWEYIYIYIHHIYIYLFTYIYIYMYKFMRVYIYLWQYVPAVSQIGLLDMIIGIYVCIYVYIFVPGIGRIGLLYMAIIGIFICIYPINAERCVQHLLSERLRLSA